MIRFIGWFRDGTIFVVIGSKRYDYVTDAVYHNSWRARVKYAPWQVLNEIKSLVQKGVATCIRRAT